MTKLEDGRDLPISWFHSDLDDFGLTPAQFRIYLRIVRRAGKDECFESVASMASGCKLSVKTVRSSLKFLVKHRLLSKHEHLGKVTTYKLTDQSLWIPVCDDDTPTKRDQGSQMVPLPKETRGTPTKRDQGTPTKIDLRSISNEIYPNEVCPSLERTHARDPLRERFENGKKAKPWRDENGKIRKDLIEYVSRFEWCSDKAQARNHVFNLEKRFDIEKLEGYLDDLEESPTVQNAPRPVQKDDEDVVAYYARLKAWNRLQTAN